MRAAMMMMAGLVAVVAVTTSAQAQTRDDAVKDDLVITTGEGTVRRAPDRAFVTVAAESRARQPKVAQQANADAMTAVLGQLTALGFSGDAVRTLSFGVEPEYDWGSGRQTLRGYLARNVVEVRIDDMARVGEVVDAAVETGATQVRDVRFTLKDMQSVEREALRLASRDAQLRAQALANGVGREVARVVRLDETRESTPMPQMMRMSAPSMAAEAAAPTPVAAGEIEVRSRVTLTAVLK